MLIREITYNVRNKIFTVLSTAFLFTLLFYAHIKRVLVDAGTMSFVNVGNEITTEEKGIAKLIAFCEDTYTNYAPVYNDLVRLHDNWQMKINEPVTNYLITLAAQQRTLASAGSDAAQTGTDAPDAEAPEQKQERVVSKSAKFINATDTHRNYLITMEFSDGTTGTFLDRVVSLPEAELQKRLDHTIESLRRICAYKTDKLNYYVYSGSRFQDMEYLSDYIPTEESTWDDLNRLFDALPDNVRYDWLKFEDGYDRMQYIYRTDHHWTGLGGDVGYREILDMMREDTPDIGDPLEGTEHSVTRLRFNGSFSQFSNVYDIWDDLSFVDYGLPDHITEGGGPLFKDAMNYYLSDQADSISYEQFYPNFTKITYPGNNTGRNLLIIGDSFARSVEETLAYHFDNTYVIFPGGGGDLNRFINRFGVTDVLILMYSDRLMYSIYNVTRWDAILTRGTEN